MEHAHTWAGSCWLKSPNMSLEQSGVSLSLVGDWKPEKDIRRTAKSWQCWLRELWWKVTTVNPEVPFGACSLGAWEMMMEVFTRDWQRSSQVIVPVFTSDLPKGHNAKLSWSLHSNYIKKMCPGISPAGLRVQCWKQSWGEKELRKAVSSKGSVCLSLFFLSLSL